MTTPLNKKRKVTTGTASGVATSTVTSLTANNRSNNATTVSQTKTNGGGSSKAAILALDREQLHVELNYAPLSLQDIHDRIRDLCYRVPVVPESRFKLHVEEGETAVTEQQQPDDHENGELMNGDASLSAAATTTATALSPPSRQQYKDLDKTAIKMWADSMQCVLEEFNLLIGCISPATYVWGTDRSGAADQNLGLLSSELVRAQDQIATLVSPRLNDVLAPVSSLVTRKTITTKNEKGEEIKQNFFETTLEDPDYVQLCYGVLARNADLERQVVLANFDKLLQAVKDYLAAQHKDSQHDARGFVY